MSSSSSIDPSEFDTIIVATLEEVERSTQSQLRYDVDAAGKEAVSLLKQRSRKAAKHGGAYAKSWTRTTTQTETGTECTVYNRDHYQLTHLLEKGHAIANQHGKYTGRVAGDNVVAGVYEEVSAEFGRDAT